MSHITGERYERQRGHHAQPKRHTAESPIGSSYLKALLADQEAQQKRQREAGIDYQSAQQRNVWSQQEIIETAVNAWMKMESKN